MKVSKEKLKVMIKEELENVMKEAEADLEEGVLDEADMSNLKSLLSNPKELMKKIFSSPMLILRIAKAIPAANKEIEKLKSQAPATEPNAPDSGNPMKEDQNILEGDGKQSPYAPFIKFALNIGLPLSFPIAVLAVVAGIDVGVISKEIVLLVPVLGLGAIINSEYSAYKDQKEFEKRKEQELRESFRRFTKLPKAVLKD